MHIEYEQLRDFLLDSGLVTATELDAAQSKATESGQKLGDILVSEGKLSEDEYRRVEAHILGIPFVDLTKLRIENTVLSRIPEPIARKHNIVAYRESEGELEVAMLDPQDLEAVEFVRRKIKLRILPRLTDTTSMRQALVQYQKSLKQEFGDIIKKEVQATGDNAPLGAMSILSGLSNEAIRSSERTLDLKKLAEDLPIVRIVDTLLNHAILQHASDIHIEQYEKELIIRYRIDGILHDAMVLPGAVASGIVARIKVLSSLRLDEKRLPQDGRFKIADKHTNQEVAFRVSILPTYYGEKVVMRLLPDTVRGFTLEGLGFHGSALEHIHDAIRQTTGMILVTGPTGSGKSTTLYTILDILNTPEVNISTIEDPIEYQMPRINQTQVKPDIGFTFASGLRTLVRQDPDVVMVGEIRDRETAMLSINAALTGHLVLSTLHTNSAAGAVPRLLDMGAEAFLLVSTINIAIAQRLVRRLCTEKDRYTLTPIEREKLAEKANLDLVLATLREEKVIDGKATWETIPFYRPKESEDSKDGYSGRLGIYEALKTTSDVKELVMKSATAGDIQEAARRTGMMTMVEDGIFKAVQGLTSLEEVFRVANE